MEISGRMVLNVNPFEVNICMLLLLFNYKTKQGKTTEIDEDSLKIMEVK